MHLIFRITGLHTNMCVVLMSASNFAWSIIGSYFPSLVGASEHYSLYYPFSSALSTLVEETGYFHIQATKPDTIGIFVSSVESY